jgi:hypothetical protein
MPEHESPQFLSAEEAISILEPELEKLRPFFSEAGGLVDRFTSKIAYAKAGKDKGWVCPREDADDLVRKAEEFLDKKNG